MFLGKSKRERAEKSESSQLPTTRYVSWVIRYFSGFRFFLSRPTCNNPTYGTPVLFAGRLAMHANGLWQRGALAVRPSWRDSRTGVLVKAVMFPLGFAFIAVLFFGRNRWRPFTKASANDCCFRCRELAFIFALSKSKGRLTYGDVGAVAYRHIMGWDVESQGDGALTNSICVVKPTSRTAHIWNIQKRLD